MPTITDPRPSYSLRISGSNGFGGNDLLASEGIPFHSENHKRELLVRLSPVTRHKLLLTGLTAPGFPTSYFFGLLGGMHAVYTEFLNPMVSFTRQ